MYKGGIHLANGEIIVEMRNITKQFGDFKANDNINLDVRKGEIHALLGENGAGKSTLMNVLTGLLEPTEGEIEKCIITERKVFNLNFNNGKLVSNIQLTDIDGKIENSLYFNENEIEYLKNRILETKNSFVKGRYANVLWQETRNNSYASIAIEAYLDLLNNVSMDNLNNAIPILEAMLHITQSTINNTNEVKKFVLNYLRNTENWFKYQILLIILNTKLFTKEELYLISQDVLNWLYDDNYILNKHILETALILFKKIGRLNSEIYSLLAINENLLLDMHPDESDFIRIISTADKALYFKKAKNFDEYNKTILEFNKLKQKTKLHKFSVEVDKEHTKRIDDYFNKVSKKILKYSSEEILAIFACDESLLVNPEEVKNDTEQRVKGSLKSLFTINSFDINNNFKKLVGKENLDQEITNAYTIAHNLRFYILFLKVFINGSIQGKLNYYKIYTFFEKHTWYGQKIQYKIKDAYTNDTSTWLSLLAPGLHNLFSQFELSALLNTNKLNNYILSIDSLTIKFEGALRDFIRLAGGNTTIEKKGLLQEQLLEELLDNPKVLEYFSKRDVALFKYTFTRSGLNIRNNTAHGFLKYPDYNTQNAALVFLCVLRLGKYEFSVSE